jgi:putative holliday junction resolvase
MISVLGLDVGRKRIGVAGCDGTGLIATGLTTIERQSFLQDLSRFQDFVEARQVQMLVVGLPYLMDGSIGSQAKQVQKFAQRLSAALQLPMEYVDERLTSVEAEQLLIAENRLLSQHKSLIDRKAAAIILQQWLDQRRSIASRLNQPNQTHLAPPILSDASAPKAVE